MVGIDIATGVVLWQQDMSSYAGLSADFTTVYVTTDVDSVIALDRRAGAQVWRQDGLRLRDVTAPARFGNTIAVGDFEGYLHFLDTGDGHFVAREHATKGRIVGGPVHRSAKTWSCKAKTARSRRTPCAPERNSRSRGAPMLPAVALVGRPNVGKSTLFNRLTGDALVADFPGLTRDRRYGIGERDGRRFIVIDTGGLAVGAEGDMTSLVAEQVDLAIEEANAVVLVVDHKTGLTPEDVRIVERLRRETDKVAAIAVNKAERVLGEIAAAEFHALGLGSVVGVSALHGSGIDELLRTVLAPLAESEAASAAEEAALTEEHGPKVAVIGRPKRGKSTRSIGCSA